MGNELYDKYGQWNNLGKLEGALYLLNMETYLLNSGSYLLNQKCYLLNSRSYLLNKKSYYQKGTYESFQTTYTNSFTLLYIIVYYITNTPIQKEVDG